jgi:hypothetical protein
MRFEVERMIWSFKQPTSIDLYRYSWIMGHAEDIAIWTQKRDAAVKTFLLTLENCGEPGAQLRLWLQPLDRQT